MYVFLRGSTKKAFSLAFCECVSAGVVVNGKIVDSITEAAAEEATTAQISEEKKSVGKIFLFASEKKIKDSS